MSDLRIDDEPLDSPDARRLIDSLDAHLTTFPGRHFLELDVEEVAATAGCFLVARLDGIAVGCGAIRLFDDGAAAEVKRMWADPAVRGRGVGFAILGALEQRARLLGATRLALETAAYLGPAVRMYERAGFRQCACWGAYADSPDSLCMTKDLAADEASARPAF